MPANKLRSLQNLLALSAVTLIITIWSMVTFLAYQNSLFKKYQAKNTTHLKISSPPPNQSSESFENWKTYKNEKYGFEIKYHPESQPNEFVGTEEVGQFTYLFKIDFGTVPLKSQQGFILEVNNGNSLADWKSNLIGHSTDKIDSIKETAFNNHTWTLMNYQLFMTDDYIPITTAFINYGKYGYAITASKLDMYQILSTFRFLN